MSDRCELAAQLNAHCACPLLDRRKLAATLVEMGLNPGTAEKLADNESTTFASVPWFASSEHLDQLLELNRIIQKLIRRTEWAELVLPSAPEIARFDPGNCGVFSSVDVHLETHQVRLIELNTNAGGALLSYAGARATTPCCSHQFAMHTQLSTGEVESIDKQSSAIGSFQEQIIAMFEREWQLFGAPRALRNIAIVDSEPSQQGLYPEFLLFAALLRKAGYQVVIAPPEALEFRGDALYLKASEQQSPTQESAAEWQSGTRIDLIYNRSTDFYLATPSHGAMREAYLAKSVLLTPHPRAHALIAAKSNLVHLSNAKTLLALGLDEPSIQALALAVPKTVLVNDIPEATLWAERKAWFFKPTSGFGSKGVYRGDKLTRGAFSKLYGQGDYLAQQLTPASARLIKNQPPDQLKVDLRAYVYGSEILWLMARLYQGQVTNMRTPGGGFAAVLVQQAESTDCSD